MSQPKTQSWKTMLALVALSSMVSCATLRNPKSANNLPLLSPAYETERHIEMREDLNTNNIGKAKEPNRVWYKDQDVGQDDQPEWGSYKIIEE